MHMQSSCRAELVLKVRKEESDSDVSRSQTERQLRWAHMNCRTSTDAKSKSREMVQQFKSPLLSQRIIVQIPAPILGDSQPPVTLAQGNQMPSSGLQVIQIHIPK